MRLCVLVGPAGMGDETGWSVMALVYTALNRGEREVAFLLLFVLLRCHFSSRIIGGGEISLVIGE